MGSRTDRGDAGSYRRWVEVDGDRTLRVDFDLSPDSTVLDAGGFMGDWAAEIAARYACRIVILEPVPEFAARAARRFAANPAVTVAQVGLAGSTGRQTIGVDGSSSGLLLGHTAAIDVPMVTLRDVMTQNDLARLDLLKLNIEGAEYGVLENMLESRIHLAVQRILVQFHINAPRAVERRASIVRSLVKSHESVWSYPFTWELFMLREQ